MSTNEIPGLEYHPDIISVELEKEIINYMNSNISEEMPVGSSASSRRVRQYGYLYNYESKNTDSKEIQPIPDVFKKLLLLLPEKYKNIKFNQCIVNKYLPGQGIAAHRDHMKFGPVIACFSIVGDINILFRLANIVCEKRIERNSLYIMSGDSRYKWTHEIAQKKYDIFDSGKEVKRNVRYSITFRTV